MFLWAASILVPSLIFGLSAYWSWLTIERETQSRLEHIAGILHEHTLRSFETHEAILEAVSQRVRNMGPDQIRASGEIHGFLLGLVERVEPSGGLIVADAEGRILADTTQFPVVATARIPDGDYAPAGTKPSQTHIGQTIRHPRQDDLVFTLSRRLPSGLLIISSLRLPYFEEFYASITETPDDVVLLTRGDGAILVRVPSLVAAGAYQQSFHRPEYDIALTKRRIYTPAAISPVDGKRRYYAAWRIGSYPVLISYGLSDTVVRTDWLRQLAVLATVCSAAALLLVIFIYQTHHSVRREHAALAAATAEARRRMEAEARLRHSQRIDALGQIVGGVAHDINNLVSAVMASARMIEKRADDPGEVRRIVGLIHATAERGGRLTRRMLTFARRDDTTTDAFDIAKALDAAAELLGSTLGPGYELKLRRCPDLPAARGDRAEFETVIINLVINARDAMPDGGVVTVTPGHETVPTPGADHAPGLKPGRYVRVDVADHGVGMDAKTLARVGEAFFTTKAPGKGTGLGLAMARTFAEQAGGVMRILSEPGRGTTVTLWIAAA